MKSKIDMAHDYAMALVLSPDFDDDMSLSAFVKHVWKYADKMQAEEDKRKVGGVPDALLTKDENGNCTHFHTTFGRGECFDCGKNLKEEWQPDWSQAPKHMNYFFMNKDGSKYWTVNKPDNPNLTEHVINFFECGGDCYSYASSQDYKGDWKDSLRKRP